MNHRIHSWCAPVVALSALSGTATQLEAAPKLVMNGKVASTKIATVKGQAYVPLSDVAKALGMVVVRKSDGSYEIKKAGGTQQVQDLSGKIGDVLFDGKWRLQVLNMEQPASFTMRTDSQPYDNSSVSTYDPTTRVFTPKPGYKLVVIQCRVTNGQKTKQTLWTSISDRGMNTALTDMAGGSHPPLAHDYEGGPNVTKPLLPGAKISFPIIFSVPENTQLKDLIFSLKNNDYSQKPNDARVSLK